MKTSKHIAAAMTVVGAMLRFQTVAQARQGRGRILDSTAATAKAMSLTLADLIDVLLFARVLIHNRLVALRVAAGDQEPGFSVSKADLDSLIIIASSLDAVALVAQHIDAAVLERKLEKVPALVPQCLQARPVEVEQLAQRLLERLDTTGFDGPRELRPIPRETGLQRKPRSRRHLNRMADLCKGGSGRTASEMSPRHRTRLGEPVRTI